MRRGIVVALAFAVFAAAGSAVANDAVTLADLAARVESLERRLVTMEAARQAADMTQRKRIEELDVILRRTLFRLAEICGEDPDQVGVAMSAEVEALVRPLARFDMGNRFEKRKVCRAVAEKGFDAIGAVPTLTATLRQDEDRFTRKYAANALGAICASQKGVTVRKALAALYKAAKGDEDPEVRQEATLAIRKIAR